MAVEPLGLCVARVGHYMPTWAPRRGARCEATAALVRACTVAGKKIELPLCVVHDRMLARTDGDGSIAADWAS